VIWILLAVLGVPLWLIVGALIAGILSRRSFKRGPGVFLAKLRTIAGETSGVTTSWSRLPVYARWVHDVLIVHQGLALVRTRALPVSRLVGLAATAPAELKRLGPKPVLLTLILDSRANVELAAAADDLEAAVGPFAAALAQAHGAEITVALGETEPGR
jgi:hypothetical protein